MAASERRRLFARGNPDHPLTPLKLAALEWVGELRVCTPVQIARVTRLTLKSAREHLRNLYDMGLVERIGIPRAALADPEQALDPALLYGRAPTIYTLTREGAKVLVQQGLAEPEHVRDIPRYGPGNSFHLAHTLAIKDVAVWLEVVAKSYGHEGLEDWREGKAAVVGNAWPDALFLYRLPAAVLVGLLEVDRGTERGDRWWKEKFARYAAIFRSDLILEATGQKTARVIVVAPSARRRDGISALLSGLLLGADVPPERFWIAERAVLAGTDLSAPVWRVAGFEGLHPLVKPHLLGRLKGY